MPALAANPDLRVAADRLLRDHFCVRPAESVLITADSRSDRALAEALVAAARAAEARPALLLMPPLPFQGALADPYIADPAKAAMRSCDIWLDLTFPYLAGSHAYDAAMKAERPRYILIGDLGAEGLCRLYGRVDFDRLFELQSAIDALFAESEGAACRITCPLGTELGFTIGKPATRKTRHANAPGSQTVPGSAMLYPVPETVQGRIALAALFDESYRHLPSPLFLEVDGKIRGLDGPGPEATILDRALRRAAGNDYGYVIHFSYGFHPAARFAGASFIEDIRAVGNNAIGLGLPWWLPGGGENHPDGVVARQSIRIGGTEIVRDGRLCHPAETARLAAALEPTFG